MRIARNIAGIGVLGSLFLLGCGDPVPPAAQAGISIQVKAYDPMHPEYGNTDCPPDLHWLNIPYDRDRIPGRQLQLTDDKKTVTAINNQDGNLVSCSVKAKGSGFTVRGSGTAYAESMGKRYNPTIVHIVINEIANGGTSKGQLSVQDDTMLNIYQSDLCTYSVTGSNCENCEVAPGKIWGKVTCDNLTDPKALNAACLVENGFFVLENCAQ